MKILLINPPSDCVNDDRLEPPLGLLYIAAVLLENNHNDIEICDMTGCMSEEDIFQKISNVEYADIYGISCMCTNYLYAKEIIKTIREKYNDSLVILGGPNPTALPEYSLNDSKADIIIAGEGEDAFLQVVNDYSKGMISKGIIYGKPRRNIDSYPFPARSLVDLNTYNRKLDGRSTISLISSRGCDNKCIFCNSIIMGGGSLSTRYRSPQNVVDEILCYRKYFSYFRFNDDNFLAHPNIIELLHELKKLKIKYRIFACIEHLTNEICRLLSESGCIHISIGLETLNPDNLRAIGKSKQINKHNNIYNAKKYNIRTRAYFLVGLPFDSNESIKYYFEKAATLGLDEHSVYPLIPYPGTMIEKKPYKFGYKVINSDFTKYVQIGKDRFASCVLEHNNFNSEDVKRWIQDAIKLLEDNGCVHVSHSDFAT